MGFMDFLFGSSGGTEQMSTLTPQQQAMQEQLLAGLGPTQMQGLQYLQSILSQDPEMMAQFSAPMMRQFEQETVPMIAERFAGMGTMGSGSSSAQNLAMAQAGKELQESLGALRSQLGMQAGSQLQGLLGIGMQPSFENVYMQPTTGLFGGLATGAGQGLGMVGGNWLSRLGSGQQKPGGTA